MNFVQSRLLLGLENLSAVWNSEVSVLVGGYLSMEISESLVSTKCPLERGAHNAEVSVEGGSTVFSYILLL